MTTPPNKTRVLTLADWSKETGLKVSTMRRAVLAGHLHARRLGAGPTTPYFVTEKDLNAWLDSRLVPRKPWQNGGRA